MINDIKIAIHHDNDSASDRWIKYCIENKIKYKIVDCSRSDIIEQLKDCDGLMWHWQLWENKNQSHQLFARQLIYSLEKIGKKVYPDTNSCWHFNDKVGQKYYLEAIGVPLVKSYVFYTKKEALEWIENAKYPKVFKLKGGSRSRNVELITSKKQAIKKIKIAFGNYSPFFYRWDRFVNESNLFKNPKTKSDLIFFLKSFIRVFFPKRNVIANDYGSGYVYFQDFITGNEFDTRLIVIGDKCFGIRRFVRKNDFRSSGSNNFDRNHESIDKKIVKIAFEVTEKLCLPSVAFDFIYDKDKIKIIEISYTFPVIHYKDLSGYWDKDLVWHEEHFNAQYWMIENFLEEINESNAII